MGTPAVIKGGWLRGIDKPKGTLIRIQNNTFDRMKLNSTRNGEVETASEIINRLLDFWDTNHQR